VSTAGAKVTVEVDEGSTGETFECPADELLGRAPDEPIVADMDNLRELNEASVLNNVKALFGQPQSPTPGDGPCSVYSSVGPVLIAMNPFVDLPIYTTEWMQAYHQSSSDMILRNKLGPHAYSTAEHAYQGLRKRSNQAVIICGESGAGKTVTNRKMIEYLCEVGKPKSGGPVMNSMLKSSVSISSMARRSNVSDMMQSIRAPMAYGRVPSASSRVVPTGSFRPPTSCMPMGPTMSSGEKERDDVQQIFDANNFLESFGNAKTTRNDNSSRFGKFTKLHFGNEYVISNYDVDHYLLERSRVTAAPTNERNYHVFYQLLKSDDARRYNLAGGAEAYAYTKEGANVPMPGIDDKENHEDLVACMDRIGFSETLREDIFQAMAAILHLGNISFTGDNDSSAVDKTEKSSKGIKEACELLGLKEDLLAKNLCIKLVKAPRSEPIEAKVGVAEAAAQRDAVAKGLYAFMFDDIINAMNEKMSAKSGLVNDDSKVVALLDIFGFEDMAKNGFEQMFINLTNERIQSLFNTVMFDRELRAYAEEGIPNVFSGGPDNTRCVSLFTAAKPPGIVRLLNDQCKGGDDGAAFVNVLNSNFSDHPYYKVQNFRDVKNILEAKGIKTTGKDATKVDYRECFGIRHYAGTVLYTVEEFVSKSRDALLPHLNEVLSSSSKKGVSELFDKHESAGQAPTVGAKFVSQLEALRTDLEKGDMLFVRCIKSNHRKVGGLVDRKMVLEQLVRGGVIAALEIRQAGLPDRVDYKAFCTEFGFLEFGSASRSRKDPEARTKAILQVYIGEEYFNVDYAFGHTKIFMKSSVLRLLRGIVGFRRSWFARRVQRKWILKQRLQQLTEVFKLWDRLECDQAHATERDIDEFPSIKKAFEDAEEHIKPIMEALELAQTLHASNPERLKDALEPFAKAIEAVKKEIHAAHDLVERVSARKLQCDGLIGAKIAEASERVEDFHKRVENVEQECKDILDSLDENERMEFMQTCKTAREHIENMRTTELPKLRKQSVACISLESDTEMDSVNPLPQISPLLTQMASLVEKAENLGYNVCRVRRDFAKAVAELYGSIKAASAKLDTLQEPARKCIAEGMNAIVDKINAAWKIQSASEDMLSEARDAGAFRKVADAFVKAVEAAATAVAQGKAELARRERERARRRELQSLVTDVQDSLVNGLSLASHRKDMEYEGSAADIRVVFIKLHELSQQVSGVREKASSPLADWEERVLAFERDAKDALSGLSTVLQETATKRKAAFQERAAAFGAVRNVKATPVTRGRSSACKEAEEEPLTVDEFISGKGLGGHQAELRQLASCIQTLKDASVPRSDVSQCASHFVTLSYGKLGCGGR